MVELEVKLGSKTGLDTVRNEKHVELEEDPPDGSDDSNQALLVRVTRQRSGKCLANGGWNFIIKRRLAYRKYVTARRFPERRPVFSLKPRQRCLKNHIG